MSNGIAKIENGFSVAWASIHDGNKCAPFFASDPVPDPLPEGYVYADTREESFTPVQVKLVEVQQAYAVAIAAGYDTGLGFSLKLYEQDQRVLFDYQQRLLRKLSLVEITLAATRFVMGTDDQWHAVTVEQYIAAVDAAADHFESMNTAYAGYAAMLAQEVTEFTVDFSQA